MILQQLLSKTLILSLVFIIGIIIIGIYNSNFPPIVHAHDFVGANPTECGTNHTFEPNAPPAAPGFGVCRHNVLTGKGGVGKINLPIPFDNLGEVVSGLLNIAYVAAGIFFLIQVVIGGISWINAGGDPKNLESARGRITNAVIGLVIVVAAFAITLIFTTLLGVNIFTGDVVDIIP